MQGTKLFPLQVTVILRNTITQDMMQLDKRDIISRVEGQSIGLMKGGRMFNKEDYAWINLSESNLFFCAADGDCQQPPVRLSHLRRMYRPLLYLGRLITAIKRGGVGPFVFRDDN